MECGTKKNEGRIKVRQCASFVHSIHSFVHSFVRSFVRLDDDDDDEDDDGKERDTRLVCGTYVRA